MTRTRRDIKKSLEAGIVTIDGVPMDTTRLTPQQATHFAIAGIIAKSANVETADLPAWWEGQIDGLTPAERVAAKEEAAWREATAFALAQHRMGQLLQDGVLKREPGKSLKHHSQFASYMEAAAADVKSWDDARRALHRRNPIVVEEFNRIMGVAVSFDEPAAEAEPAAVPMAEAAE